ncbi:Cof-type HAD-IIB family hydrolase [Paenibacillus mendelii]|uniref:Cof-type HAD-IIB family hydrolase n=1 Tax=Paenibacillus mendelii TaxID=206163 RepID=A0ABV6J5S1_9BACL|nr:Cof-type HAD-IIB family hydrolase [Paenibacillus mendelii]MCQ6559268.1 Cof-type HAD-IIB family hydrolase [Paenibacillus mendelii]
MKWGEGIHNIQAIVLDLDGTLLNSNKEVSSRNLQAVMNGHRAGMKIIIATARPPRSVKAMLPLELLNLSSLICYNGAWVCDAMAGIEEHIPISQTATARIIEFCLEHLPRCIISLEVQDQWYSNQDIIDSTIYDPQFHPIMSTVDQLKAYHATKILLTEFDAWDHLQLLFGEEANIVVTDQGKLIQIMNKSVSKDTGIMKLCGHYGIKPDEIIVFGDDYNDMEMFRMSGYSIAMQNAVQELKDIASEVTASNDEHGVAIILERLLSERISPE